MKRVLACLCLSMAGASVAASCAGGNGDGGKGGGGGPDGYWSSFPLSDLGCVTVGGHERCGPYRVSQVAINEESTEEILAECVFGAGDVATAPGEGFEFVCHRLQADDGSTREVVVSSPTVANLPVARMFLDFVEDGTQAGEVYVVPVGGLHAPDGSVHADPYQKKEYKFAGDKRFYLHTRQQRDINWMREHALQPLLDAGYTAVQRSFESGSSGSSMEVWVWDTLDARVLIEETVLRRENWKVRPGEGTKGNKGTYDHDARKYRGTFQATMELPGVEVTVWEITGEVTWEKDPDFTGEDVVYTTTDGTLTQISYTFPSNTTVCVGEPDRFEDTVPIFPKDGYLTVKAGTETQPARFQGSASISGNTPVQEHPYQICCSYRDPACEDEVMERGEQEHEWWSTGPDFMAAQPDGTLSGTYRHDLGASYEWSFAPVEETGD